MNRVPFGPSPIDPRRTTTFLDSCAFDPKYEPETTAANLMLSLYQEEKVVLLIAHSVESEIEHPNTPQAVKGLANDMNRTRLVGLTNLERERLQDIKSAFIGSGRPEKYEADAQHIFEAGKWAAYFVTTDERILKRRDVLETLSRAKILRPTEWVAIYHVSALAP